MSGVLRPVGVASRLKRPQGLSCQGEGTLAAIWGPNEQADPSQAGGGCPGTAVEDLLVYVENGTGLTDQAPADGLWEVGRAHGPTTVEGEQSGKPLTSNTDAVPAHSDQTGLSACISTRHDTSSVKGRFGVLEPNDRTATVW